MKKTLFQQKWLLIAVLVLGILVPLLNRFGLVADTTVNLLGRHFCFAIAAMGVNMIWGYTGILSLCQAFFFCLGGYAVGMHMLLKTGTEGVYGSALPDFMVWNGVEKLPLFWKPFYSFPVAVVFAILVPALVAGIFGFFAFRSRIKGVYFAIITQAFALAMWLLFLRNETMLGGTNGLTDFKTLAGLDLGNPSVKLLLYVVSFAVMIACYFLCRYVVRSKLGRLLIAVRDGEQRLRFIGYNITNVKIFVFVLGALLAALGGFLYVPQTGIVTPGTMDVQASIEMVIWVALGGRGTLLGPILGALLVNILYSVLTGSFPASWPYFLGFLFVGVVLFFPDGIVGVFRKVKSKFQKGKSASCR